MKIGFLHYTFDHGGVTTVVRNNAKALIEAGHNVTAYAGSFKGVLPDKIRKGYLPFSELSPGEVRSKLEKVSTEEDVMIFENPTLGIFPEACLAIQRFVEETNTPVIYRAHDLLHKRTDRYLAPFLAVGGNIDNMYPDNATVLTLTKYDQSYLKNIGVESIYLPNSVDVNEWKVEHDPEEIRNILERKIGISKNQKIILYPGRFDPRKNHPEAIAITKALGSEYFLIGTLLNNIEEMKRMAGYASKIGINFSFGQVGDILDELNFGLADFLAASDLVITTSLNEGFGFNFIEPWLAGVPILGRNLLDQTQDFQNVGVDLSHLYIDSGFDGYLDKDNVVERMIFLKENKAFSEKLAGKILQQKKDTQDKIKPNRKAVIDNFSSGAIGKKLEEIITREHKVPNAREALR